MLCHRGHQGSISVGHEAQETRGNVSMRHDYGFCGRNRGGRASRLRTVWYELLQGSGAQGCPWLSGTCPGGLRWRESGPERVDHGGGGGVWFWVGGLAYGRCALR